MTLLFAILLGFAFGFVLHKVGATNAQNIIGMLRFENFHLAKAILFAIGFSSLLLFLFVPTGLVDLGHFSVKASYIGVMIGGLILGIGWAMGGYCPGTGVAACATGDRSAIFYVVGGLLGALAFTFVFSLIEETFLFDFLFSGKASLASITDEVSNPILPQIPSAFVAGTIGVLLISVAFLLPTKEKEVPS